MRRYLTGLRARWHTAHCKLCREPARHQATVLASGRVQRAITDPPGHP